MISISTKLSVKELAGGPTGFTVSFLYKARMKGMPMKWDPEGKCFVATPGSVKRWIKASGFHIVDGYPVVKKNFKVKTK